jgi:hypothetical protein
MWPQTKFLRNFLGEKVAKTTCGHLNYIKKNILTLCILLLLANVHIYLLVRTIFGCSKQVHTFHGCQMVYFHTENANFGILVVLAMENVGVFHVHS